jgi:hypothetical protein
MPSKYFWYAVLAIALSFVLCMPAEAQKPDIGLAPGGGPIGGFTKADAVGVVVGVVAVAVVVTILVVHYSGKRSVTGCVTSGNDGMTITDEKDKRVYALSGNTVGIKPGDRVKLHGKKAKPNGADTSLLWLTERVDKDFGVCRP